MDQTFLLGTFFTKRQEKKILLIPCPLATRIKNNGPYSNFRLKTRLLWLHNKRDCRDWKVSFMC